MHRTDNSKFLLFIEPRKEHFSGEPERDKYVETMIMALAKAKKGTSNYSSLGVEERFTENSMYRGVHYTDCGENSSNQDYLLENGMITNSLAPFYLLHYRK